MENNAKIVQDLMNASKFLNFNDFESDLVDLIKNIEEKEKEIYIYFDGVKLNVNKCLQTQIEKKSKIEKDLKQMSDDLVIERQKSKEYFEQISKLEAKIKAYDEDYFNYKQKNEEFLNIQSQNVRLNEQLDVFKSQYEELKKEFLKQEKNFLEQIVDLKKTQQTVLSQLEKLKQDNTHLIGDIKIIMEEKSKLSKDIENERIEKAKLRNELEDFNKKKHCFVVENENKFDQLNSKLEKYAFENERLGHLNLLLQNDYNSLKQKVKNNLELMYQNHVKETIKLLDTKPKTDQVDSSVKFSNRIVLGASGKEKRYSQSPNIANLMALNISKSNLNDPSNNVVRQIKHSNSSSSIVIFYPDLANSKNLIAKNDNLNTSRVKQQVSKYEEILK